MTSEREHEELMWVLNRIADEIANIAAGLAESEPDSPPVNPMFGLMNTSAAAEFLGRPESTLSLWRHKGIGPPHVKIGSRVFYRRDDLLGWVQAQMDGDA